MARVPVVTVLLVLAALAASAARPPVAWACSCAGEPAAGWLDRSDAAFVGEVLAWRVEHPPGPVWSSGDPAYATFRVESALKGTLPRELVVRTVASSASCGLSVRPGERVALLLDRRGDEWTSGLCAQFEPSELDGLPITGRIDDEAAASARRPGGIALTALLVAVGAVACAVAVGLAWTVRRRGRPEVAG